MLSPPPTFFSFPTFFLHVHFLRLFSSHLSPSAAMPREMAASMAVMASAASAEFGKEAVSKLGGEVRRCWGIVLFCFLPRRR